MLFYIKGRFYCVCINTYTYIHMYIRKKNIHRKLLEGNMLK